MSPSFQYDLPMRHSSSPIPRKRYSQHSKAADVSRLLDPTYLSSSTSSSPTSVYVDHHGDLHDPDYRDFPAIVAPRRPMWERGSDELALDDDVVDAFDERARLRTPRERRRERYSQYSSSSPTYPTYTQSPFEEPSAIVDTEKRTHRKLRHTRHVDEDWDTEEVAPKQEQYIPSRHEEQEWTPTCAQQIRRQWQSISLSVRFSIFRAQRKMRRKVGV
ncbi:hypothetical protein BV25DRAFT_1916243 [Artomyces pyxidatus]|uniref:Uncharacterized protein n=1 Tax=Artomyces pyxidatus TaxID=48021 RepID=A0ACB8T0Y8_9AGAM|nr:hypothetical protein BV25DRAFT_1916243 [Artomyces pyxidatus]